MSNSSSRFWIPVFFGIAACSWMPHWSCHYYRIETGSSFVAGNFNFTVFDSFISMLVYSILIGLNLFSISFLKIRFIAALSTGILHLILGIIHIIRFAHPFIFKVFGFDWSMGASLREVIIVIPFGIVSIAVAVFINRNSEWIIN